MKRASGIIMPIFSLPGDFGIGTMGEEAFRFIDFLNKAKQKYWQVLPVVPTSCGNSPYSGVSVFAGNPNFIDLEALCNNGILKPEDIKNADWGEGDVDYNKLLKNKPCILRKAYENVYKQLKEEVDSFAEENASWIYDYALYSALKEKFN